MRLKGGLANQFNEEGKLYSEVSPRALTVRLPSGDEKVCQPKAEFDQLVKLYMEQ